MAPGSRVSPAGGRCLRARELAERRAAGEELSEYDGRLLESHLHGCGRCREYVAGREAEQATVVGGQDEDGGAKVERVEAAGAAKSRHAGSTVDAMGQDKRRAVVGERHSASRSRQLLYYAIAIGITIGIYFGAKLAVDELDKPPAKDTDAAPWAQPQAPQEPAQRFE